MSKLKIEHIVSNGDMGEATEQDAQTWADHVEKRLGEQFPGADISVKVNNRQSGVTHVDGEQNEIDSVHQFLKNLWDNELSIAFPG